MQGSVVDVQDTSVCERIYDTRYKKGCFSSTHRMLRLLSYRPFVAYGRSLFLQGNANYLRKVLLPSRRVYAGQRTAPTRQIAITHKADMSMCIRRLQCFGVTVLIIPNTSQGSSCSIKVP